MDVINIGRSRRFLKERPIRVTLFDRPRLVCDLICLEAGQTEKRRGLDTSDSLYVVVEGTARLTSGAQIEELQAQDAALIPPGVDHTIENNGSERLTVMALVTPKPARAGEVRMPVEGRPRRPLREEPYERPQQAESIAEAPRERPQRPFTPRPPRGGDRPYRGQRPARPPARGPQAARPAESEAVGPAWFPRPKPAWRPRGGPPSRPGGRPPSPRGAVQGPAPRRREGPDERESLPEERPRRGRFSGPPAAGESRPAPRGRTGGRPAGGARGGAPRGAPRGRGGASQAGGGEERPRGRGAARGAGSPRPAPRGSRPSGPRGQGRSGPRTSGRRPAP
jgi:quercetin dioxygenase-like cupin family protein